MKNNHPSWEHEDYPHYYFNKIAIRPIETQFRSDIRNLYKLMGKDIGDKAKKELYAEETIKNSLIEGISLDRDSIRSSFLNNLPIKNREEADATKVTKLGLSASSQPLTTQFIKELHRALFHSSDLSSKGVFVGDMSLIAGGPITSAEPRVVDRGMPKEKVEAGMDAFVDWFNQSKISPLAKAAQGHLYFEGIHPL